MKANLITYSPAVTRQTASDRHIAPQRMGSHYVLEKLETGTGNARRENREQKRNITDRQKKKVRKEGGEEG